LELNTSGLHNACKTEHIIQRLTFLCYRVIMGFSRSYFRIKIKRFKHLGLVRFFG